MSPSEKTIAYLRTLTFDGCLSSDEVWCLAKFLNQHEDCRAAWPGNVLFPVLGAAFHDGLLIDEEMRKVAVAISEIEQQWLEQAIRDETKDESPRAAVLTHKPAMPTINTKVDVPSRAGDVRYQVNLLQHSCTCADWRPRELWPSGHPGRCCKHVAFAFARTGKVLAPWLQALLDDCFMRARGTHPQADWLLIELRAGKPVLASSGAGQWSDVFAPSETGYERFGYNRAQNRWSYGDEPFGSRQIEQAIRENFASF